ncbi:hypothetical protein [Mycoplasma anserisalpingitidis]|uniref:hypothetical protein n=1 Tax=Mycoplasma anserisalpingitidis TaxID=519450 RepID=UPI001F3A9106|nr:hypothetical protein [Mycoplasma anserisalpingitidis]
MHSRNHNTFADKEFNDFFAAHYEKNYRGVEATLKLYQEKTGKKVILLELFTSELN